MPRWSYQTLLEPDRWAELVGFNLCHWAGVSGVLDVRSCADRWFQHSWQADPVRAGRETVGQAVFQAEQKLADRLRFYVAPRYITNEVHITPCSDILGLGWGYLQEIGTEARDTIEVGAAVAYSDTTGDGLDDTGTITVTVPVGTDECEIAVYYPSQIDANVISAADETWRVKPLDVEIVGTTATITGSKCQFVRWLVHVNDNWEATAPDISDNTQFMSTVDVYRRYTDPTNGAVAIWDDECDGICTEQTQSLCALPINERVSTARLTFAEYSNGTWSAASSQRCRPPDRIRINYLAGWNQEGFEDCAGWRELDAIVAQLSLTLLRENICQCSQFSFLWNGAMEEFELATTTMASAYSMFGTMKMGALHAYNFYVDEAITPASTLSRPRRQRRTRRVTRIW